MIARNIEADNMHGVGIQTHILEFALEVTLHVSHVIAEPASTFETPGGVAHDSIFKASEFPSEPN